MGNWVEEAEKRQKEHETFSQGDQREGSAIIIQNHQTISAFIKNLTDLAIRVSRLAPEERKPSIEVGATHLEGDLRYEFYGSAFQNVNRKFLFIFRRNKRFIFWRRLYITVTDTPGVVKITLYEKGTSEFNHDDVIKKKLKFLAKAESLKECLNIPIIDWLVYKSSSNDLKRHIPSVK